jgi:hypothetical protein
MSRHRRSRRPKAAAAIPVTDPDLVALWPTKAPEGQAMLALLQEARDRNRTAHLIKPPPPTSSLYLEEEMDTDG